MPVIFDIGPLESFEDGISVGILVQNTNESFLSPQVKDFIYKSDSLDTNGASSLSSEEVIPFFLTTARTAIAATEQGQLPCPCLWMDKQEVEANNNNTGSLHIIYKLSSSKPQLSQLPLKPIPIQWKQHQDDSNKNSAVKSSTHCTARLPGRTHMQLYRIYTALFPKLESLARELTDQVESGNIVLREDDNDDNNNRRVHIHHPNNNTAGGCIFACPVPGGLLLEWQPSIPHNITSSSYSPHYSLPPPSSAAIIGAVQLLISINLDHACLELEDLDRYEEEEQDNGCLRSINSLAEALSTLTGLAGRLAPSPFASPVKNSSSMQGNEQHNSRQSLRFKPSYFQSPAKPATKVTGRGVGAIQEGVEMIKGCSSSQLRDGAALLQGAIGHPGLAARAIEMGAGEALITAAATILPGVAMGMTEALTLVTLTITGLLDAASSAAGGVGRIVKALSVQLSQSCANPLLLCKLVVALLQRTDVRTEAMRQGLAGTICEVYLRKSPLLEATARALLNSSYSSYSSFSSSFRASGTVMHSSRSSNSSRGTTHTTSYHPHPHPHHTQPPPPAAGFGSPLSLHTIDTHTTAHRRLSNTPDMPSPSPTLHPSSRTTTSDFNSTAADILHNPAPLTNTPPPPPPPPGSPQRKVNIPKLLIPGSLQLPLGLSAGHGLGGSGSGGMAGGGRDVEGCWSPSPTPGALGGLTRSTRRALSMTPSHFGAGFGGGGAGSSWQWNTAAAAAAGTANGTGYYSTTSAPWGSPKKRNYNLPSPFLMLMDSSNQNNNNSGGDGTGDASFELAALSAALGESIMASDLPAIVAHKRRGAAAEAASGAASPVMMTSRRQSTGVFDEIEDGGNSVVMLDNYRYTVARQQQQQGVLPVVTTAQEAVQGRDTYDKYKTKEEAQQQLQAFPILTRGSQAARKPALEAHKIFTSARSLRSLDSSPDGKTSTSSQVDPAAPSHPRHQHNRHDHHHQYSLTRLQLADVTELKILLLTALISALPVMMGSGPWPDKDITPVLAAELLTPVGRTTSQGPLQPQLKKVVLEALARLAARAASSGGGREETPPPVSTPDGRSPSPRGSYGASPSFIGATPTESHVFITMAGCRLSELLEQPWNKSSNATAGGKITPAIITEATDVLTLLAEYQQQVKCTGASAALIQHCMTGLQAAFGVIQAGGTEPLEWPLHSWKLLHAWVLVLGPACNSVGRVDKTGGSGGGGASSQGGGEGWAGTGRSLLSLILGDHSTAAILLATAELALLQPPPCSYTNKFSYSEHLPALQHDILVFFVGLAGMISRQPAVHSFCDSMPSSSYADLYNTSSRSPLTGDIANQMAGLRLNSSSTFTGFHASGTSTANGGGPAGVTSPPSTGKHSNSGIHSTQQQQQQQSRDPAQDVLLPSQRPGRRPLTRRHALHFFSFLVTPSSGFAAKILEAEATTTNTTGASNRSSAATTPKPHSQQHNQHHYSNGAGGFKGDGRSPRCLPGEAIRLRGTVLDFLKETLGATGSPYTADKATSDYYIRLHFIQFLKLYHNPYRDHQALFLCRKHIDVLLALATEHSDIVHIRQRFLHLSVVEFFVKEVSLEFEATQRPAASNSLLLLNHNAGSVVGGGIGRSLSSAGHPPQHQQGFVATPLLPNGQLDAMNNNKGKQHSHHKRNKSVPLPPLPHQQQQQQQQSRHGGEGLPSLSDAALSTDRSGIVSPGSMALSLKMGGDPGVPSLQLPSSTSTAPAGDAPPVVPKLALGERMIAGSYSSLDSSHGAFSISPVGPSTATGSGTGSGATRKGGMPTGTTVLPPVSATPRTSRLGKSVTTATGEDLLGNKDGGGGGGVTRIHFVADAIMAPAGREEEFHSEASSSCSDDSSSNSSSSRSCDDSDSDSDDGIPYYPEATSQMRTTVPALQLSMSVFPGVGRETDSTFGGDTTNHHQANNSAGSGSAAQIRQQIEAVNKNQMAAAAMNKKKEKKKKSKAGLFQKVVLAKATRATVDKSDGGIPSTSTSAERGPATSPLPPPPPSLSATFNMSSLPPGFSFTGDLDEDVDLLLALEEEEEERQAYLQQQRDHYRQQQQQHMSSSASKLGGPTSSTTTAAMPSAPASASSSQPQSPSSFWGGGEYSPIASPTIPALRQTPFSRQSGELTAVGGGASGDAGLRIVPLLGLPTASSKSPLLQTGLLNCVDENVEFIQEGEGNSDSDSASSSSSSTASSEEAGHVDGPCFRGNVNIPRLAISPSLGRSTLELRCANAAELVVAQQEEQARALAGRSFFLGELERKALGKGKMQAAAISRHFSMSSIAGGSPTIAAANNNANGHFSNNNKSGGVMGSGLLLPATTAAMEYEDQRRKRLVYKDHQLHIKVLHLIFALAVAPDGQLDPSYCDQYPWDCKMVNIPFLLTHHLTHPDNAAVIPALLPRLQALGPHAPRLLRSLCGAFYRSSWYNNRSRISGAAGAYATVYRCALPDWLGGGSVVLKMIDAPHHIQDRCSQVDFHSEVTILDILHPSPLVCRMYDHGLDPGADSLCLVLKDYRCNLRQWRAAQPVNPHKQLSLYLSIFRDVVAAVLSLLEANVVHFDLKCDNILLEPLSPALAPAAGLAGSIPPTPQPAIVRAESEFWSPPTSSPPFRSVLADFGESKIFQGGADGASTVRARGTDAFKSPEMLLVGGGTNHRDHKSYDRRRRQGAGASSDVWSLGCLLFELVTGKLLFNDTDWLQLVARVTATGMPLITDDKAAMVSDLPGVLGLLQFLLVREPSLRPSLVDVLARVDAVLRSGQMPGYERPAVHAVPPLHSHHQFDANSNNNNNINANNINSNTPPHQQHLSLPISGASSLINGFYGGGGQSSPTASSICRRGRSMAMMQQQGIMCLPMSEVLPLSHDVVIAPVSSMGKDDGDLLTKYGIGRVLLLLHGPRTSSGRGNNNNNNNNSDDGGRGGGGNGGKHHHIPGPPVTDTSSPSPGGGTASKKSWTSRLLLSSSFIRKSWKFSNSLLGNGGGSDNNNNEEDNNKNNKNNNVGVSPQSPGNNVVIISRNDDMLGSTDPVTAIHQIVLGDANLTRCVETCSTVGVECIPVAVVVADDEYMYADIDNGTVGTGINANNNNNGRMLSINIDDDNDMMSQWLRQTVPLLCGVESGHSNNRVMLVVSPGCEGDAAALVVGHWKSQLGGRGGGGGGGLYPAMVQAARWGLDTYLNEDHIAALQFV